MLTTADAVGLEPFHALHERRYSLLLGIGDERFENVPSPELVHESLPPVTKHVLTFLTVQVIVDFSPPRTNVGFARIATVGGPHRAEQVGEQLCWNVTAQTSF